MEAVKGGDSWFFTKDNETISGEIIPMGMKKDSFIKIKENLNENYLKKNSFAIDENGNLSQTEDSIYIDGRTNIS